MRIDVATLFPEMCEAVLSESILGRARKNGALTVQCWNIRDYTLDKHRRVDDVPYGGGRGMVMQADPIYRCYEAVQTEAGTQPHRIYLSPKGSVLTQQRALELAAMPHLFLLCGHYEGVDQRILDTIIDEEISIGDYVLTGGELPAMVLIDTVARMLPGVLPESLCFEDESHFNGLLEYPQYTRPAVWHEQEVPPVLLTGHHKNIAEWRLAQSLEVTKTHRPDLYDCYLDKK
ncbi:tRNA (guanosine(37)-N1)-methyltransferase TrmD [uncultured Ruminococcus sp.]|uniref:tRNA (guanosine(37)-N1)-methyltransferase TrmD n=1 Tax=uncultured Ruminococcus sp. TaxID=165186 RepID=UPI002674695A|nr:tRNA (guanosine(37)-N1)-methyltransferase TrmD [uncultured Ruminococcus sp.]